MFLLEITVQQSAIVGVLMILGVALFIIMVLMKSPKEKHLSASTPADEPAEDTAASFIEYINQGNTALTQFQYDKALDCFQAALKIKNNEPSLHFKIGRVFTQKEDYKNAISAFRNAIKLNPEMLEAHFELARIFQNQQNLDQAHQELDQALAIKPEHEECLKLKIKLYEQAQHYEQALPVLKKLISVSQFKARYQDTLADYLIRLNRHEEAIAEYQRLMEAEPLSRLHYLGKIGQAYFEAGLYAQSIDYFKLVLQEQATLKDPTYAALIKSQMAAALCNEGVRQFHEGQSQGAIQLYQEALLYDDTNPDIHYNLGKALASTHETLKALQHFEAAISLHPQDVGSYYEMAVLQDEKGMVSEAVASYEKVLALDPSNLNATFGLGTLYGVQGDMDKAIQYLTAAVSLNPEFVDAIYNLGVALERKKDFNKAMKMYKKVLTLDAAHEKARGNLAHILHLKGNP